MFPIRIFCKFGGKFENLDSRSSGSLRVVREGGKGDSRIGLGFMFVAKKLSFFREGGRGGRGKLGLYRSSEVREGGKEGMGGLWRRG